MSSGGRLNGQSSQASCLQSKYNQYYFPIIQHLSKTFTNTVTSPTCITSPRIPSLVRHCRWFGSIKMRRPITTILSNTERSIILRRKYFTTFYSMASFNKFKQFKGLGNSHPFAQRLSRIGYPVHAISFLKCWPVVRSGRHLGRRCYLHILCSHFSEMLAHTLPTSSSPVAGIFGHCRNCLPCWTRSAPQMVTICAVYHKLFSRCRPYRMLLRVQCVCGHKSKTSCRILLRRPY